MEQKSELRDNDFHLMVFFIKCKRQVNKEMSENSD